MNQARVIFFEILRSKSGQEVDPMDRPVTLEGPFTRKCHLGRMRRFRAILG